MSETAEEQDTGGGFQAEEEAMRKRHKKESGVSFYQLQFYNFFILEKQNLSSCWSSQETHYKRTNRWGKQISLWEDD